MASELPEFVENLRNSTTTRGVPLFFPLLAGLNLMSPHDEMEDEDTPRESETPDRSDRVILINPFTQNMVVVERRDFPPGLDSLLNDLVSAKSGQPPASKASIDAMVSVEILGNENDDERCAICFEWEVGEKAKEMPCKHRFHGTCVEKWLKIHGSCPVCRYEMPVDEEDSDDKKRISGEGDGTRSGIWMRLHGDWRGEETD